MLDREQQETLEGLVDRTSLQEVLEALGEMCHSKASHLRVNWQSYYEAREWEKVGRKLDSLSYIPAIVTNPQMKARD